MEEFTSDVATSDVETLGGERLDERTLRRNSVYAGRCDDGRFDGRLVKRMRLYG